MKIKVFIDLCCGLGGASQAFYDDPDWKVIRLDNNADLLPLVPGLTVGDIVDVEGTMVVLSAILRGWGLDWHEIDLLVIWASPPCTEFSLGFNAAGPTAARNGEDFEPSMDIVNACHQIIQSLMPDHWYIENVRGAITPFSELLGPWRQQVGSFFLWGNHPLIDFHDRSDRHVKKLNKRHAAMRAQLRALVPLVISKAILTSIEHQKTLF